jgi:diguanylate cyclase (GGDEF)-like protein/PAS domain S-box-containing protein
MLPRHLAGTVAIAAAAIGAGLVLPIAGWLQPHQSFAFSGVILAAVLTSAFAMRRTNAAGQAAMSPSFVIDFTSLLLFGPGPTMLVVAAGTIAHGLADSDRSRLPQRMLSNAVTIIVATQAAGFVHRALGGTMGHFIWPAQLVPIAAAVVVYCFIRCAAAEVLWPLVARASINRSWHKCILLECPNYFIGAGLAAAIAEVIDHRMWQVLPAAAVPLYFAYRAYCEYASRLEEEHRRREVIESLDQGMSVVDHNGRITLWNDALERIAGCQREQALDRLLVDAMPALAHTELPRAISEALKTRSPQTLSHVGLPSAAGGRILQVKLLPVAGGVTLLWHDVTEKTRGEHALKRSEERLALAAEGANDGLWEWDLRTQELYLSGQWKAMMGLTTSASIGRPEEWTGRVHADDLGGLREALKVYLAGKADRFEHEHRIKHEDGTYRWFLCRAVAVRGAGQRVVRIAGSLTDTTDRAIAREQLRSAGSIDPLTGLRNRAIFVEGLGQRLDDFKQRRRGGRFAVLYLDLDRFKIVNDSLGHLAGDELLIAVSRRLESCLRQGDSLARLGGDEFVILLNTIGDEGQANAIAFEIQEALRSAVSVAGREVFTSASIGIAFGDTQHTSPDEIMRDADTAMYHAKAHGKARHELFDAAMHKRAQDRLSLENDLRHAVKNHDFEVVYQPIVFLATGMCVGFESLVRWTRDGKPVSPVTFIPMAEELGLIESLGTWILQHACRTFADFKKRFPACGLDFITVNVSSRQLLQQHFRLLVEQALDASGLKPCDLRLEITETALMDNPNEAAELLRQLRDFGVKIYLDDFGTGYSSLSHLHKLPVDALKIDRSFVNSLLLADRPAIVESILALARTLNTSVVAEGIEREVQARELERLGCTHAQGYLFSRPLSAGSVEELLTANEPLGPKKIKPSDAVDSVDGDPYYRAVEVSTPSLVGQL